MVRTVLADVIVPDIFFAYIQEEDDRVNRLAQTGAMISDPLVVAGLAGGGTTFQLPSWESTDGATENISSDDDSVTGVINAVTSSKQIIARLERNQIWGSSDLVAMLAGSDPLASAAARIAQARTTKRMGSTLAMLDGLLNDTGGAPALSSHINDIAEKATAAAPLSTNQITVSDVVDTLAPYADTHGAGNFLIVHSDVHRKLLKDNFITFEPTNAQDIGWGTYIGMTLVVQDGETVGGDGATKVAGTTNGFWYVTYLVKPGAMTLSAGVPKVPVEVDREPTKATGGGIETLVVRDSYAVHTYGMSFTGSPAVATPSNVELAAGGNWAKVYPDKKIGVASLHHNI